MLRYIVPTSWRPVLSVLTLCLTLSQLARADDNQTMYQDSRADPALQPALHGEEVDPFSGNLRLSYIDLSLKGSDGNDLTVWRTHVSSRIETWSLGSTTSLPEGQSANTGVALGWRVMAAPIISTPARLSTISVPIQEYQCTPVWNEQTRTWDSVCAWVTRYDAVPITTPGESISRLCDGLATETSVETSPVLEFPNGSSELLYGINSLSMKTRSGWKLTCQNGVVMLYNPQGGRYTMDVSSRFGSGMYTAYSLSTAHSHDILAASRYENLSGGWQKYSYSSGSALSRIDRSDGRWVSFSYAAGLLNTLIADDGRQVVYSQESSEDYPILTRVSYSDGRLLKYEWFGLDVNGAKRDRLKSVTNEFGGKTTYTWIETLYPIPENERGLSGTYTRLLVAKRVVGSDSYSYTYLLGGKGSFDEVLVDDPVKTTHYKFIGAPYNPAIGDTATNTSWRVGLLMEKSIGADYAEMYQYDPIELSSLPYIMSTFLHHQRDNFTWMPVLKKSTIYSSGATMVKEYSSFDQFGNPQHIEEVDTAGIRKKTDIVYDNDIEKNIIRRQKSITTSLP